MVAFRSRNVEIPLASALFVEAACQMTFEANGGRLVADWKR